MAEQIMPPQPDTELKLAYTAAIISQMDILTDLAQSPYAAAPDGDWGDDILRTQAALRMSMLSLQRLTTELERQGFTR